MKKVLVLLLLMVSTNVFAEWLRLGEVDDGDSTFYVDLETIKRKGNKVKMWDLSDSKTVKKTLGGKEYFSSLNRIEYDCEEETRRILDAYRYSGNMKNGGIVFSYPNVKDEAESIIPESLDDGLFKIACGKK